MSTGATVEVSGLSFRYPGADQVLHELNLSIVAGERIAVLGPNGSGKTTFVLHLNGLLELQSGSIQIGGLEMSADHLADIRRQVGAVFQDPDDQLFMQTVGDDVAFGPANLGIPRGERDRIVGDALASVGASQLVARTSHHLSGGEKRRVAIATVLAMNPDILVLDEPTSGLDPVGRRELAELLDTLPQTQVVVTHDLPFALATCPRAIIVSGGTVVADGPTDEMLRDTALLARHGLELPYGYRLQ